MTTIILVSIGVLIAAVAAIFMIFFGGDAWSASKDKADAARLVGDGVQIQAAVQMFRAQEDRMPGNGSGVDAAAMSELVSKNYLKSVPKGLEGQTQEWKIDWNYGIARSVIGRHKNADGSETRATAICRSARAQLKLPGEPKRCDEADIPSVEPCCIMNADDASA